MAGEVCLAQKRIDHKMKQRSKEWFEARKGRVNVSLVGAILGLSPYMTSGDAMRVMVREALGAEREFKGNAATEWGATNEPGALVDYRLETMNEVVELGPFEYDGWLSTKTLRGLDDGETLVRIYCPYAKRKEDGPPFQTAMEKYHIYAAMQFEMLASRRGQCHFFQWSPYGTKLETVPINIPWLDEKVPRVMAFQQKVIGEARDFSDFHLAAPPKTIDTPAAHKMLGEWDDTSEQLRLLLERRRELKDQITGLGAGGNIEIGSRKIYKGKRDWVIT